MKKKILSLITTVTFLISGSVCLFVNAKAVEPTGTITVTVIDEETNELFTEEKLLDENGEYVRNFTVYDVSPFCSWSSAEKNPYTITGLATDKTYVIEHTPVIFGDDEYYHAEPVFISLKDGDSDKEVTIYMKDMLKSEEVVPPKKEIITAEDVKDFRNHDFTDFLQMSDKDIYEMSDYSKKLYSKALDYYCYSLNFLYVPYEFTTDFYGYSEHPFSIKFNGEVREVSPDLVASEYNIPKEVFNIIDVRYVDIWNNLEFDDDLVIGDKTTIPVLFMYYTPSYDEYTSKHVMVRTYMKILDYYFDTEKMDFIPHYENYGIPLGSASSGAKLGDIDESGAVDLSDLTNLSLYLLKDKELTDEQKNLADVDSDGLLGVTDLSILKQYIMGDNVQLGISIK